MNQINWDDFEKVELRVGKIVRVEEFPEAKKPAYKLEIDFGKEIGVVLAQPEREVPLGSKLA